MSEIYVIKYALTQGIFKIDAEPIDNWKYAKEKGKGTGFFLSSDEFAFTKEEAIEKAEDKKRKKIVSLEKQLVKIRKIDFETQIDNLE